jgi:hypothetical protein
MVRPTVVIVCSAAAILSGCQGQPKTNAANTGGGGIGPYQDHHEVRAKSGAEAPGNADSPAESNGGTGGAPQPYPTAVAQSKANEQSSNPVGQ